MVGSSYRHLFENRPFRRFWIGFTLSMLGDNATRVALTWYVYETTRSPEALGWLMLCYTGPIVLGGLMAGWLLDRFDRRVVLIVDSLVRGMAVASIPLLAALGMLALWQIYVVAAIYGLLMMIALAGTPSIIPDLVAPEDLATANALEMLSFTLAGVVGPMLAGLLIARIGAPNVVLLDAFSYMLFALMLTGIRRPAAPQQVSMQGSGLGHALRLLLTEPVLLATTGMFLLFNIGNGMLSVWLPILADTLPGGGPELYGVMLGAIAVGETVSALIAGGLRGRMSLGVRIGLAQLLSGAALALVLLGGGLWTALVGHHRNDEVYSLPANDDAGGGRNAQDLSRDVDR
jgi:hypothetical protein